MSTALQLETTVSSYEVTELYNSRRSGKLADRIFALHLGYLTPILRKVTSIVYYTLHAQLNYLSATSASETRTALSILNPIEEEAIAAHVYCLSSNAPELSASLRVEDPPLTKDSLVGGAFTRMLDGIQLLGQGGKRLNFVPVATRITFEDHIVGLVIVLPRHEQETGQILLLDSKGAFPDHLYLPDNPLSSSATSNMTCADVIKMITVRPQFSNYSLWVTPNFQNPRDCVICTLTILRKLALQVTRDQDIDLAAIIHDIHTHYEQITAVRDLIIRRRSAPTKE